MGPQTAQRIEAISQWKPPAGVTWVIHYQASTGSICLTMRVGDFCDIHFVLGSGERERQIAVEAAEALRDRWLAELDRRQPIECEEQKAAWYQSAGGTLRKLDRDHVIDMEIAELAYLLLMGVECEDIMPPSVTLTAQGRVRFTWNLSDRGASIEIQPRQQVQVTRWTRDHVIDQFTASSRHVQVFRNLVGWLFPAANAVAAASLL